MSVISAAAAGAATVRVTVGGGGGGDTTAPSVPQNLDAVAVSSSQINLTWSASTDNVGVDHYNIYRDNVLITTSPTSSYNDTGLSPNTLYSYEVSAQDAAGNESARSTADSATTQAGTPPGALWVSPSGSGTAYTEAQPGSLSGANGAVGLGGTVILKGGNYSSQIRPTATPSQESQRITYQAAPGEQPVITSGGTNAINLASRSYITIDGIDCSGGAAAPGTATWDIQVLFNDTHRCILQNGSFVKANSFIIHMLGNSSHNKILNNYVDYAGEVNNEQGECINIRYGHHNLIAGNTVRHGGHNLINNTPRDNQATTTVEFTDNNVFRNNILNNDWSDVANHNADSGYRCASLMEAKFCVIEGNIITGTGNSAISNDVVMFKIEGRQHIVRNNFMWDGTSRGFTQTVRVPETPMSFDTHVYNNSVHSVGHGAVGGAVLSLVINTGTPPASDTANNKYKNNAIFDCDIPEININPGGTGINGGEVINNAFGPSTSIANSLMIDGSLRANGAFSGAVAGNFGAADFGWANSNNPTTIAGFTPGAGSPLINAGAHLTTTVGAGSNSTTMVVADSKYFYDGFGISGEVGDMIQLASGGTARITAINYATHTLTLDAPLTWANGVGVSLPYNGSAPDIGAVQT